MAASPIARPALAGLAAVMLAVLPDPAAAGAWTLAKDAGQFIASATLPATPPGMFTTTERDSNTGQLFVEYGIMDGVTAGVTLSTDYRTTTAELEARAGAHVRLRLWTGEAGDVVSGQAGVSVPIERFFGEAAAGQSLPGSVTEIDLRALYGRGWRLEDGDAFVSSELGFRFRGEGQDEEILLDITGGFRPFKRIMGLLGIYSTVPLGDRGTSALKLAPSIAYTLYPRTGPNDRKPEGPVHARTIQLGLTYDTLNPEDGLGVTLGIWQPF